MMELLPDGFAGEFADAMDEGYADALLDPAVIGPSDDRRRVIRPDRMPYAAVCYLERSFGSRNFGCTGTLIAPDLVLTAGHCLIRRGGQVPDRIRVQPGRNGPRIRESLPVRATYVPRRYAERRDPLYDFGLIRLAARPRTVPGPVFPHAASDAQLRAFLRGRQVQIAGYPSDKPRGTMWTHGEVLRRFDRRQLLHVVDTCPGHSGSAVLARIGRCQRVIGIHVAGVSDPRTGRSYGCHPGSRAAPEAGGVNRAIRITPVILAALAGRPVPGGYAMTRVWPPAA
ncbi:serine protease [Poseidonocella sp. HB161398]|uniref:trypsin-like serine peptidase n=1 Tax=Poseidonocella sp. HB161398 TaxID=2320855 RepID=UPI001109031D|nr:trypsin-like serine protease [Poseidonocella sp. HB161398]